jgi:hypothetical protein|tara:strand:- start:379 stop:654 length:276 start_codon:yes stop_codon:yes gene_type:complete
MASRKNTWRNPIYEMMKKRAIPSHEIPIILNELYRDVPSSVKVSAVLSRDERFRSLGKHYCYGLSNSKSHQVIFFGRADTTYDIEPPFKAK